MTGIFNPPLVPIAASLDTDQKTRAAALLVARQACPETSVTDLLRLAEFIVQGAAERRAERSPFELFGSQQMDLDPAHPTPHLDRLMDNARLPNFGDLEATEEEEDGLA